MEDPDQDDEKGDDIQLLRNADTVTMLSLAVIAQWLTLMQCSCRDHRPNDLHK